MIDHGAEHQMADLAALHALGALSQHEARAFEQHLAEGCLACRTEVESFEQTVSALAFSAPEEQPPERVRWTLLARVSESPSSPVVNSNPSAALNQFVSIRDSEGEWHEVQDGVMLKTLYVDKTTGIATSLVRMLAGTSLPVHQHLGVEQFFVIEGDCNVAGQRLRAGDYHRAAAGSTHDTTYTVEGTLFLLIAPERYEVLEAR